MLSLQFIFIAVIGATFFFFIMLLFSIFSRQSGDEVRSRMEQYLVESEMAAKAYVPPDEEGGSDVRGGELDASEDDWIREVRGGAGAGGAKKLLANIGTIITPRGMAQRIAASLAKADLPLKANEFVAIQFLTTMLPLIFGLGILRSFPMGLVLSIVGYFCPLIWLAIMKSSRQAAFSDQIMDTLITLSNGMKAGYSFLQALEMVAKEAAPPMSTELRRVIKENSLGMNLEDAMRALNTRVESEDWDLVTTVVLIQRQVGGNLSEILDKIGYIIRQRMKIKGDIQTKTAQAKVSGGLVGALPIGLGFMIYLINPNFMMKLFTFKQGAFRGWFVVIFGIIWEVIGMYIIMKIVDIEV